jgi:hypothetical protein
MNYRMKNKQKNWKFEVLGNNVKRKTSNKKYQIPNLKPFSPVAFAGKTKHLE